MQSSDTCRALSVEKFDILLFVHGIAIGLTITRILQFVGAMLVRKSLGKVDKFHLFWLLALTLYTLQYWFFIVRWKGCVEFNFLTYILSVFSSMLFYLVSIIICPTDTETNPENLDEYFDKNGGFLFILVGLTLIIAAVEGLFIQTSSMLAYPGENLVRIFFGLCFVSIGVIFRSHKLEWTPVILLIIAVLFRLFVQTLKN